MGESAGVFLRLAVLFVTIPLLELALLVLLGEHIGLLPTVALVVLTGILGAALARQQGMATWARFQEATNAGRMPHRELVEGLLVLVAGAVLLTPGLLTDVTGFLLLVPPVRAAVAARITASLGRRLRVRAGGVEARGRASMDVQYRVVRDEPAPSGEAAEGEGERRVIEIEGGAVAAGGEGEGEDEPAENGRSRTGRSGREPPSGGEGGR